MPGMRGQERVGYPQYRLQQNTRIEQVDARRFQNLSYAGGRHLLFSSSIMCFKPD